MDRRLVVEEVLADTVLATILYPQELILSQLVLVVDLADQVDQVLWVIIFLLMVAEKVVQVLKVDPMEDLVEAAVEIRSEILVVEVVLHMVILVVKQMT